MEVDGNGYPIEWVPDPSGTSGNEDGVCDNDNIIEEEYLVGDEIIPSSEINTIPNSLDQIAAENLIYMAHDGNVAIMGDLIEEQVEQAENADYNGEHQYFECQVQEEVITDDWVQQQGEDRVEVPVDQIGSEACVGGEDVDVPLPTDQDEYTTSRPYPCDFCSRRFRKKSNLMNHMVAHKNDRPHICNLCGARYIRRVDLLNHLKVHAQVPEQDGEDSLESLIFLQSKFNSFPPLFQTSNPFCFLRPLVCPHQDRIADLRRQPPNHPPNQEPPPNPGRLSRRLRLCTIYRLRRCSPTSWTWRHRFS